MNQTTFEVIRFTNRNETTSWRVTGWLHGLRIRKNFRTREEAAAEKSALEIKSAQTDHGMRTGDVPGVVKSSEQMAARDWFQGLVDGARVI